MFRVQLRQELTDDLMQIIYPYGKSEASETVQLWIDILAPSHKDPDLGRHPQKVAVFENIEAAQALFDKMKGNNPDSEYRIVQVVSPPQETWQYAASFPDMTILITAFSVLHRRMVFEKIFLELPNDLIAFRRHFTVGLKNGTQIEVILEDMVEDASRGIPADKLKVFRLTEW